jgi:hypothetical protein
MSSVPSAVAQNPAPNPVDQFGRLLQMKALLNQQSLFPGQQQQQQNQLQAEQQENQLRQQQLDDMNKIQKIAPNYVQKDDSGKVTGYDFDGLENGAIAAGVHPQSLAPLQTMRKNAADTLLAQSQANAKVLENVNTMNDQFRGHLEAVSNAAPEDRQAAYQAALDWSQQQTPKLDISHLPPANQLPTDDKTLRPMLTHFETSLAMGSQITKEAQEKAEAAKANAAAALDQIKVNLSQNSKPGDFDKNIDAIAAPNGPNAALNLRTKSMVNFALGRGDIDSAQNAIKMAAEQVGAIEKETNPAVVNTKITVATAEAQAKQLVEGLAHPVYAVQPDGTKKLMSETTAIQSGLRTMLPVTAKEVGDDTMLINRLGDVHQKIAQYEQNLANLGKTVTPGEQGNIAGLIDSDKFKVGAFGTEVPVNRLNALLDRENLSGLSSDARKLLVSYYNARESIVGYQRVLAGSARGGEKQMDLNLDTLPNPGVADASFAAEGIKQFKQNLRVVGQGLPQIPGVKSPEEIEREVTPGAAGSGGGHIIQIGRTKYQYKGSGNTADLANYTALP